MVLKFFLHKWHKDRWLLIFLIPFIIMPVANWIYENGNQYNQKYKSYLIDLKSSLSQLSTSSSKKIVKNFIIDKGDTLSNILDKANASEEVNALISVDNNHIFNSMIPGEKIQLTFDKQNLTKLTYIKSDFLQHEFSKQQNKWVNYSFNFVPEVEIVSKVVELQDSIFLDGNKQGISDKILMNMADLFAWDIDYAREVYPGDKFKVIYKKYLNSKKEFVSDGEILAAQFIGRKTYSVFLYKKDDKTIGYYDEKGIAAQKSFLRNPVKFVRITSNFNPRRMHPILHKIRAHRGVDYAGVTGTPIYATANGTIIFKGWKGGYGRVVIIKHMNRYSTLYAHMSRFAGKLRKGKKVKQGQIIGYIGRSGKVTGSHLHYEFRVNGVHRDPLRVKFPNLYKKIKKEHALDYKQKITPLITQLENLKLTSKTTLVRKGENN